MNITTLMFQAIHFSRRSLFSKSLLSGCILFAAMLQVGAAQQTLQYHVAYVCNGERVVVSRCRKDSDMPGFPPTQPANDYCAVVYPDHAKRNGITFETAELRADVVKKLETCNALPASQPRGASSNTSVDAYLTQANKYLDQEQYAKAIAAYKQVIALRPSNGAYVGLGFAYYKLDQYQDALPPFEQAVRLKPDDAPNQYWLGVTHFQLKQYPDALAALQNAIRLNPNDAYSYHWLGEVYLIGLKQYEKAATAYQECRRRNPGDARNHNELGLAYDNLHRYEDALAEFKEAVRLKPAEPLYQSNLGIAYLRLRNTDEAEKVSVTLEKLDEKRAEDLDEQISAMQYEMKHSGNQQGADQKSPAKPPATKVAMQPNQPSSTPSASTPQARQLMVLGSLQESSGQSDKALESFRRAIALNPDTGTLAEAHIYLGSLYDDLKQYDKAVLSLREALRLNPVQADEIHADYLLGVAYIGLGRKTQAMEIYQALQSLDKAEAGRLYRQMQGPK